MSISVDEALRAAQLHKARPDDSMNAADPRVCVGCGGEIRKVPGGRGTTWVHADGRVVGNDGFYITDREFMAICDLVDGEVEDLERLARENGGETQLLGELELLVAKLAGERRRRRL
jgi:hypothetical protein